jgi:sulfur transfer complex TusBCD TusB component (DsrH family)
MENHTLVLSDSKIIISGLSLLLKQNGVTPVVKSGTIPGYELTLDMDELFVDNRDLEKAKGYIEKYKKQINKDC